MTQIKTKAGLYKFLFFLFLSGTLIIGYATFKIVNFMIEDFYNIPLQKTTSLFYDAYTFKNSYSLWASWFLVTGIILIPISYFHRYLSQQDSTLYTLGFRNKTSFVFISLYSGIAFFYVVHVVFDYFSGQSDFIDLLHSIVTLSILSLGILFIFIEKKWAFKMTQCLYHTFFLAFLGLFSVATLVPTYKYAAPKKMKDARADLQKIQDIKNAVNKINNKVWNNKKSLPKSKNELIDYSTNIPLNAEYKAYEGIDYVYINNDEFKICANFLTDIKDARRLRFLPNYYYKPGYHCLTFSAEKQANRKVFKEKPLQPISIRIRHYYS